MDSLAGGPEEGLSRARFSGCSQRFFRALRLPDRGEDVAKAVFVRQVQGGQNKMDSDEDCSSIFKQ